MHPNEPKRVPLAQLPTPVVELSNLARQLGVPRVLVKRDDLSGFELSGNKVRKLEYVVADALAHRATTLVTHGGFQSNHCRATAAIGARLGLNVRLLLRSPDPNPPLDG
ncbi:MAG TPA: pyridoxal-phosphate dependent enzyme, partial [Phycisphaerae bacterium]|nr:pyridoxal-phosphate dependent enzyme [Phycisphaerae bacterium]